MTPRKISDLPDAPYKEVALEAQNRGRKLVGDISLDGTALTLIGALDLIRELIERIEKLESEKA